MQRLVAQAWAALLRRALPAPAEPVCCARHSKWLLLSHEMRGELSLLPDSAHLIWEPSQLKITRSYAWKDVAARRTRALVQISGFPAPYLKAPWKFLCTSGSCMALTSRKHGQGEWIPAAWVVTPSLRPWNAVWSTSLGGEGWLWRLWAVMFSYLTRGHMWQLHKHHQDVKSATCFNGIFLALKSFQTQGTG